MKKIILSVVFIFILASNSFASGIVEKMPQKPLTSVIYKEFQVNDLSNEVFEHWMILRTNPFDNSSTHHHYLHNKLLETWENNGWRAYYLPPYYGMFYNVLDEEFVMILRLQAFNSLRRFKHHQFQKVVEYEIPVRADVEIVFEKDSDRVFYVLMPEFDEDPLFNTFKYRGEKIEDFFQKTVFEKLEREIRRENNYIDVRPTKGEKRKMNR